MTRFIVPGTFDPITLGHIDVVKRASRMADDIIVAVAASPHKKPLFSLEERVRLAADACAGLGNVTVEPFSCLLVDYAREKRAHAVVRGLRAVTDFEYEFQQSALNYQLDADMETVFLMSPPEFMFLSSSVVREIASYGGNIDSLVTPNVAAALKQRFAK